MNTRGRFAIYRTYLFATAGIGFTLPFLPLYLGQQGLSDRTIGWISTVAAISGLAQFPIGVLSDRIGTRKPFLVAALVLLTLASLFLEHAHNPIWIGILVVLFAENGICRAIVESLSGAQVTAIAADNQHGAALGMLRMIKPIGIIAVAVLGSRWAEHLGVAAVLGPLIAIQGLGVITALMIKSRRPMADEAERIAPMVPSQPHTPSRKSDFGLMAFVIAMILFHAANAPGGVYLGLFLKRDHGAPESLLAYAFVASMVAWMLVTLPAGHMADKIGRKPLLIFTWTIMSVRLLIVSVAQSPMQIVANQLLDGLANGLFSVIAAAWVTDRLADPRRAGEAQVIVGTSLVFGSAVGPFAAATIVDYVGYRAMFAVLAAVGALATVIVATCVPETLKRKAAIDDSSLQSSTSNLETLVPVASVEGQS